MVHTAVQADTHTSTYIVMHVHTWKHAVPYNNNNSYNGGDNSYKLTMMITIFVFEKG